MGFAALAQGFKSGGRIGAGLGTARFFLPCASPQNAVRDSGPFTNGARSRKRIAWVPWAQVRFCSAECGSAVLRAMEMATK
jgi:hypothetical protein